MDESLRREPDEQGPDADEVRRRLDAADRARAAGPAGDDHALRAYRELQDWLDPAAPADAERIRWVADHAGMPDARFERLMGRAAAMSRDPALLASVSAYAARIAVRRGEFERAEAILDRAARGSAPGAEPIGTGWYVRAVETWGRASREHEAYVACALALAAGGHDDPASRVALHGHMAAVASVLEDWDMALEHLALGESHASSLPPDVRDRSHLASRFVHADALTGLGRCAEAHAILATVRLDGLPDNVAGVAADAADARQRRLLVREGEHAAAVGACVRAVSDPRSSERTRNDAMTTMVESLAALGAGPRAATVAADWVARLPQESARLGAAVAAHTAARLYASLEGVPGTDGVRDEVAALGARAHLDRIEELDRFARDARFVRADVDRAPLARFRRRFVVRRRPLLRALGRCWTGEGASASRLRAVLGAPGTWSVCPYCFVIEREAAPPLAAGHLIAHSEALRAASRRCGGCADA